MNFRRLLFLGILALAGAALAVGMSLYFKDRRGPEIALEPSAEAVNLERELTVTATDTSGIRSLEVSIVQNGKGGVVDAKTTTGKPSTVEITFDLSGTDLDDGPFTISASAVDGSIHDFGKGNANQADFDLVLDSRPPNIAVQSGAHNLNQGGSGLIAYTVSDDAVKSGVSVGERFFPGYEQETGAHLAFFAFAYDMTLQEFEPVLIAVDKAGNSAEAGFRHHANARKFRRDTINIPPRFLETKMPRFRDDFPDTETNLDLFIKVNRELRESNRAYHHELAGETSPRPLWSGTFMRLPNSARMAGFGDRRTYFYDGEKIDEQRHLGVDLASVKADKVPAANSGDVVFAGDFGIYGKTVVIDHGLGLMTLYGHLRQINVAEGDTVEKGEIIGRTGATGLAGGDHLHFGTYVSGVPVNPVEWWDPHWIEVNVADRIGM
jgi:murein DD-endopeptidase MepM/ murein hydrolase activator NlpD